MNAQPDTKNRLEEDVFKKNSSANFLRKRVLDDEKRGSSEEKNIRKPIDLINHNLNDNKPSKSLDWKQKFTKKPKFSNPFTNNKYTKGFLKNRDWNGRLQLPDASLGFGSNVVFVNNIIIYLPMLALMQINYKYRLMIDKSRFKKKTSNLL